MVTIHSSIDEIPMVPAVLQEEDTRKLLYRLGFVAASRDPGFEHNGAIWVWVDKAKRVSGRNEVFGDIGYFPSMVYMPNVKMTTGGRNGSRTADVTGRSCHIEVDKATLDFDVHPYRSDRVNERTRVIAPESLFIHSNMPVEQFLRKKVPGFDEFYSQP